jgi:hypothetical protein
LALGEVREHLLVLKLKVRIPFLETLLLLAVVEVTVGLAGQVADQPVIIQAPERRPLDKEILAGMDQTIFLVVAVVEPVQLAVLHRLEFQQMAGQV